MGHDSNPTRSSLAHESYFTEYRFLMEESLAHHNAQFGIAAIGDYQDFENGNSKQQYGLVADWSYSADNGTNWFDAAAKAIRYKDDLMVEDERDEFALLFGWSHLIDARSEIAITTQWQRLDYRLPSLPLPPPKTAPLNHKPHTFNHPSSHHSHSEPHPPLQPKEPHGDALNTISRRDELAELSVEYGYHWGPTTRSFLSADVAHIDSTISQEKHLSKGIELTLEHIHNQQWQFMLSSRWENRDYASSVDIEQRNDDVVSLSAKLKRWFGDTELSCEWLYIKHDSNISLENYRRSISRCGLTWYF